MSKKVVITGYSSMSSLGNCNDEFRERFLKNQGGINNIQFTKECDDIQWKWGRIEGFDFRNIETKRTFNKLESTNKFALASCKEALSMAGLESMEKYGYSSGIVLGTTYSGGKEVWINISNIKNKGPRYVTPLKWSGGVNSTIGVICIEFGIKGYNNCIVSETTSSHAAIKCAYDRIASGQSEVMIVIGVEAVNDTIFNFAEMIGVNSKDKKRIVGPFDQARNGVVLGEACGVLVLESKKHAEERNAKVFGEISGVGFGSDGKKISRTDGSGLYKAIEKSLENAGKTAKEVDFIYSSANASTTFDKAEAYGLLKLYKESNQQPPITALKSMIGEVVSAGGVMSVIGTLETFRNNWIPSVCNLCEVDEEFIALNIARVGISKDFKLGLVTGMGAGGDCYSFVLTKVCNFFDKQ